MDVALVAVKVALRHHSCLKHRAAGRGHEARDLVKVIGIGNVVLVASLRDELGCTTMALLRAHTKLTSSVLEVTSVAVCHARGRDALLLLRAGRAHGALRNDKIAGGNTSPDSVDVCVAVGNDSQRGVDLALAAVRQAADEKTVRRVATGIPLLDAERLARDCRLRLSESVLKLAALE